MTENDICDSPYDEGSGPAPDLSHLCQANRTKKGHKAFYQVRDYFRAQREWMREMCMDSGIQTGQ